jgi:hypothetical protein
VHDLNELQRTFLERLEKKGVERCIIPGFVRNLANAIFLRPHMSLSQVNNRLQFLGWGVELDYHTLELARACFEAKGLGASEYKPSWWFENHFDMNNVSYSG